VSIVDKISIPIVVTAGQPPDRAVNEQAVNEPGVKQLGEDKITRNRAGFDSAAPVLRKPSWIRVRIPAGNAVARLKSKLRANRLVTVCEEAS